jgi:RNA polymerase sigma factor (sigma-70 family)
VDSQVFLVDDDDAYRRSLRFLLESSGFAVRDYPSAEAFLRDYRPGTPGCLVLDLRMPGLSGIELQEQLRHDGVELPIIFITGHGDVPVSVQAMKSGALDFLEKPFDDAQLVERIREAFELDAQWRERRRERERIAERLGRLTRRETEVLSLLVQGLSNKEIAERLEVSHRTVEVHRARIMHKMEAGSLAELVQAAVRYGLNGA